MLDIQYQVVVANKIWWKLEFPFTRNRFQCLIPATILGLSRQEPRTCNEKGKLVHEMGLRAFLLDFHHFVMAGKQILQGPR